MARLALCALTVAAAAAQCLGEPVIESATLPMELRELIEQQHQQHQHQPSVPPTDTPFMPNFGEWTSALTKVFQTRMQKQAALLNTLMKATSEYFQDVFTAPNVEHVELSAVGTMHEMLEMITTRMTNTLEGVNELMAQNWTEEEATKYMKDVRLQDVVIDALWASFRGMQTNAWVHGGEEKDLTTVANQAAKELLSRMYHNLRAAGLTQEDIVMFMPKTVVEHSEQQRNMGKRYRGYGGYGYGGYGHGGYGYGYPVYGYSYGYPMSYGRYSYGYPMYYNRYSYGYPMYSSWGWRRLQTTPNTTPRFPGMPTENMMMSPFRTMGQETLGMGMGMGMDYPTPMMGSGYTPSTTGFLQTMGTNTYRAPQTTSTPFTYNTNYPYDTTTPFGTTGAFRGLAPLPEMTPYTPETGVHNTAFGMGHTGRMMPEMPF